MFNIKYDYKHLIINKAGPQVAKYVYHSLTTLHI